MKKIFTILIFIVLSACMPKYKIATLLKTEKYEYKISYPKNWSFFIGSTDASMLELSDGSFLHSIAIITKQYSKKDVIRDKGVIVNKAIGGTIQIFVLDKNNIVQQNLLNLIGNNPYIWSANFSNKKNNKTPISLGDIYGRLNDSENKYGDLNITIDIDENRVILFSFHGFSYSGNYNYDDYSNKDKEKIGKEFYEIINSLYRYNISNK